MFSSTLCERLVFSFDYSVGKINPNELVLNKKADFLKKITSVWRPLKQNKNEFTLYYNEKL